MYKTKNKNNNLHSNILHFYSQTFCIFILTNFCIFILTNNFIFILQGYYRVTVISNENMYGFAMKTCIFAMCTCACACVCACVGLLS